MKKMFVALLTVVVVAAMSGCTNSPLASGASSINSQTSESSVISSESSSSAENSGSVPTEKTKFERFEDGLDQLGLSYKKITMGADLVGAEQGIKYKFDDGSIEMYKFDKNTDAYKKAAKDKSITLEGFGSFPAEINDDLVLMFDDNIKSKSNIEKLFNSLT